MKEYVFACIAGVAIGVFIFIYVLGGKPIFALPQNIDLPNILQNMVDTWNRIPEAIRALIIPAVLGLVTTYMTITKVRAMDALQQKQTELATVSQQNVQLQGDKQMLERAVTAAQASTPQDILTLQNSVAESQSLVTGLQQQLKDQQRSHNTEVQTLQNIITELKMKTVEVAK